MKETFLLSKQTLNRGPKMQNHTQARLKMSEI